MPRTTPHRPNLAKAIRRRAAGAGPGPRRKRVDRFVAELVAAGWNMARGDRRDGHRLLTELLDTEIDLEEALRDEAGKRRATMREAGQRTEGENAVLAQLLFDMAQGCELARSELADDDRRITAIRGGADRRGRHTLELDWTDASGATGTDTCRARLPKRLRKTKRRADTDERIIAIASQPATPLTPAMLRHLDRHHAERDRLANLAGTMPGIADVRRLSRRETGRTATGPDPYLYAMATVSPLFRAMQHDENHPCHVAAANMGVLADMPTQGVAMTALGPAACLDLACGPVGPDGRAETMAAVMHEALRHVAGDTALSALWAQLRQAQLRIVTVTASNGRGMMTVRDLVTDETCELDTRIRHSAETRSRARNPVGDHLLVRPLPHPRDVAVAGTATVRRPYVCLQPPLTLNPELDWPAELRARKYTPANYAARMGGDGDRVLTWLEPMLLADEADRDGPRGWAMRAGAPFPNVAFTELG